MEKSSFGRTGLEVSRLTFGCGAVGGLIAVIWADAIQAIVLMVGAVVCLVVMLFGVDGGPMQVLSVAAEADKFSLGPLGIGNNENGAC